MAAIAEKKCPMDKPICVVECAWYADGKNCFERLLQAMSPSGARVRKARK